MNELFFFDTETTGIPVWSTPSDAPEQPHIIQLAAIVVSADTRDIKQELNVYVQPDEWVIPPDIEGLTGITNEKAMAEGIPEAAALTQFLQLWNGRKRVAHNTTFDNRIVRIATKRFCEQLEINRWHKGDYICTGSLARKALGETKMPKLADAYEALCGKPLEQAHDALADTLACMELFFALQDRQ